MQVKILGSAAGGGFPQWNCACPNCARLRAGTFQGTARTQAQLAVRETGKPWCLINASPDLRSQILADSDLAPQSGPRHSPIAAVILTGADVDQVIGLLHLREFHPFHIYLTPAVEFLLRGENSLFNALQQTNPQAEWKSIAPGSAAAKIKSSDGADLDLAVTASTISTKLPGYSERRSTADASSSDTVIGLQIESPNGRKIFCAPALPNLEESWLAHWNQCDAILIDGTFWSDDELVRTRGGGGTLERLAKITHPRKIYCHINNTNPILDEESAEHRAVREAGWEIAYDGMVVDL
jgi:pyrroloquinoline quinone biosynthesis protein B